MFLRKKISKIQKKKTGFSKILNCLNNDVTSEKCIKLQDCRKNKPMKITENCF